jgi:hypothetical protein
MPNSLLGKVFLTLMLQALSKKMPPNGNIQYSTLLATILTFSAEISIEGVRWQS